jgi:RNA polymerase sigma-70 factor (ECF subfamily)
MSLFRERPGLLERFRAGERSALTEVYLAYVDRVAQIVRHGFWVASRGVRIAGARASDVPDLVQEAFARAFAEAGRLGYDGLRDYGPYLAAIARNLLVDWARRRGRELSLAALGEEPLPAIPAEELPYADAKTMQVVEAYLAGLEPLLASVHRARYLDGLPQREAAERLGISRQRLRTCEEKLRRGLRKALRRGGVGGE